MEADIIDDGKGRKAMRIRKAIKESKNGSTAFQTLWDAAKVVLRGRFIAIQASLKNQEKSQII